MWGRKDKKEKRGERRKGGGVNKGGMPFMGFGVPASDESEAALEAELLALQGKSPKTKKSSGKSSKVMSLKEIDSMVTGLDGVGEDDEGDDDGSSDDDDDELLAELKELANEGSEEEEEEAPPIATPTAPPTAPPTRHPDSGRAVPSSEVTVISERLAMYERAIADAKSKGESSKARRYTRAAESIRALQKKAQSGKSVNLDDLPPPVVLSGGGGGGPQGTTTAPVVLSGGGSGGPQGTTTAPVVLSGRGGGGPQGATTAPPRAEVTDEDLMSWANSEPPAPKPKPRPPQPKAPPTQPKPRPSATPTTSDGRIDLDAPEFDEFNLSDEDLAMLAAQMDSHTTSQKTAPQSQHSPPQPKPRPQATPPQPKPRRQATPPQPKPRPPALTSDGRIDLDALEFDEFNLSEEDMAMLAAQMGDDMKKQKLDSSARGPAPAQSLPATLTPGGPPSRGNVRAVLGERRDQYAAAMRLAKTRGNMTRAQEYGKMAARFSKVVKVFEQGQSVDLSQVPPPPPGYTSKFTFDLSKYQAPPTVKPQPQPSAVTVETPQGSVTSSSQPQSESDSSIPIPKTVMEALEQRLAKYESTQRLAEEQGESSRARRMARMVKQYREAIKMTKAGKTYDYSELPDPPGYPPIPALSHASLPPSLPKPTQSLPPQPTVRPKVMPSPNVSHDQMDLLTQRRAELLAAIKEAKVKGDRETALHYLKQYKGMENMIVAARNGLPVDLSQIPPSPYADLSSTKPSAAVLSHLKPATDTDRETFDRIKKQLKLQVDLCTSNAKTCEEVKSAASAVQYENMSREIQQQLLAIEGIQTQGLGPPKFTMETRKFTIVHAHNYLSAQQCEVEVVKATTIPCPEGYEEKDLSVYAEVEFPWPNDDPPKVCTEPVKGTSNPEFNHKELFDIERKHVRSMLRVMKRNPLRATLWQKRTLRKHLFIGQGVLQLEKLETKCEVRATADLVDERGRKPVGGKIELVARLREPFSGRDSEVREEQWLVFQETIAVTSSVKMPRPTLASGSAQSPALSSPVKVDTTTSAEALKIELSLVQSAIKAGHKDPATLQKERQIQARLQVIGQRLASDAQFRAAYPRQVAKEMQLEQNLETRLVQAGKMRQAKILQLRRQAMMKEMKAMTNK